ncbi:hypothetical protein HY605_00975 [Candidatus Peregrinibacteria bacterium]|nr:hypothetical protein [Candidatus Peregrinibacteria bacterium]
MNYFETWGDAVTSSLQDLFYTVVNYLPNILAALIVLIVGILVASSLGKLVVKLIALSKVDALIDKAGVNKTFKAFGKIKLSTIVGWLVKWFLVLGVLIAVAEILKLDQIIDFLGQVATFIPSLLVAVVILFFGFVAGNFVAEVVIRTVKGTKLHSGRFLASLSKWIIIIFALKAGLDQLKDLIDVSLINDLFRAFIYMLALAGALAFGLGGKDQAAKWLEDLRKKL